MTCHFCRKDFPWILFGRYCMTCYWRAASMDDLSRATRKFLALPGKYSGTAQAARGQPPTPSTITRGPDGKARPHGTHPS